jgi:hypothetical protein
MYKLGNMSFGTKEAKEAKEAWILKGILDNLGYIGKESTLSITEKELLLSAKKDLNKLIKEKNAVIQTQISPKLKSKTDGTCEEMDCENCAGLTGHVLKKKPDLNEMAWTCTICGKRKT